MFLITAILDGLTVFNDRLAEFFTGQKEEVRQQSDVLQDILDEVDEDIKSYEENN